MDSTEQLTSHPGGGDITDAPRLRAGERVDVTLESWGRLGEAMARHNGEVLFVLGGIPGERVTAEVVRVHRKYASATVVEVLEPSPDRVDPPCPYFEECTGCQWQHLDYDAQLAAKRERVVDALARVGGLYVEGGRSAGSRDTAVSPSIRVP